MIPWTEKYKPKKIEDIEGHEAALKKLSEFILHRSKKAALIYGPTGVGKTCSVYALASKVNYEIIEVNASDFRDKKSIDEIVGNSLKQQSLFNKSKIILIDEIDGLSGTEDRGGAGAVAKLLEWSSFPVILTANDPWQSKLSSLRRKCLVIEFEPLDYSAVFNVLRSICEKEKIKYDEDALKKLARSVGSDLRGAINDLQILTENSKELVEGDLDDLGIREQKDSIFNALKLIFKSKKLDNVIGVFDKVDMDLDECFLWLDENIGREYTKSEDLVRAYDALGKADVFNGRIRRGQYWRFLVYKNALMTAGVALSKKDKYNQICSYKKVSRILKLWIAKQKYMKKKSIAEKVAKRTHTSSKRVIRDTLPYLQILFKKGKNSDFIKELELNEEEVNWLIR